MDKDIKIEAKDKVFKKNFKIKQKVCDEMYQCCTHYNTSRYTLGYAMYKPFRVAYCENCEEVHLICNGFLSFIFEHILSHFWDGTVYLSNVTLTLLKQEEVAKLVEGTEENKNA
ncbi:MAG: hypothetical protein IJE43_14140 [Alphaproteobacteria bacterium]|nr:hypothetical protein [Alphaproteobacteria bacterium]